MDQFRSWAMALCAACIFCTAITMLFPEGSSKKLLNMIMSVMVLCVLFKPLSSLGSTMLRLDESIFDSDKYESSELNESIAENAESIYSAYIEENCGRILRQNNISYENIVINTDINEDYSISIGQVEVIVKNQDVWQSEKIKELLSELIGFEPIVTGE